MAILMYEIRASMFFNVKQEVDCAVALILIRNRRVIDVTSFELCDYLFRVARSVNACAYVLYNDFSRTLGYAQYIRSL